MVPQWVPSIPQLHHIASAQIPPLPFENLTQQPVAQSELWVQPGWQPLSAGTSEVLLQAAPSQQSSEF